jgi:signal transduction histidine kinase
MMNLDASHKFEEQNKDFAIEEFQRRIIQKMVGGTEEAEIFDFIFDHLKQFLPYDRLAVALIEHGTSVRLHWVRAHRPAEHLKRNYRVNLCGSSLENVLKSGQPRILDDLEAYLVEHPDSASTKMALADGIRSSLTCPLLAHNKAVGFLFFSSSEKNTYRNRDAKEFSKIAECLSLIVDHTFLMQVLSDNQVTQLGLGRVAHDLRSPLSIFRITLDFLGSQSWFKSLDTEKLKYFDILNRNCKVMLHLIEDLEVASQIGNGVFTLNKEPVSLSSFFDDVVASAAILAEQKRIHIDLHKQPDLPERGYFDSSRLRQAIMNLLSNAVKFSCRDTRIELKVEATSNRDLQVTVADQGAGIPEKELSLLFQDFSKTSVKPTQGETSTGLGLAIVRKIIDAHDGEIFVRTKPGLGSEFTFQIPISKPKH